MTERPRLLYIDDDDGLRTLAARKLARHGYQVDVAGSGPEGVAMARATRYALIAVDHYMPGHDGLATLALLSEIEDLPPVIYVTGSEESRIAVAALKAGAADYVVKTIGDDFFDLFAQACDNALAGVGLRREKMQAEEALQASNQRLEALLREVNHRVSNSLQLVSAFVHMQARAIADPAARDALDQTQQRISAIKEVHHRLYTSDDAESIDVGEYLAAMAAELEKTWSTPDAPRNLTVTAAPVRLSADKAISLGVIVNELVSNACKYAYRGDVAGAVRIRLEQAGEGSFTLAVEDDGRGLDDSIQGTGLGTRLIDAMAKSLRTTVDYASSSRGVTASLTATC